MIALASAHPIASALSLRLSRLARLGSHELKLLQAAGRDTRRWPARREILAEGKPIREPRAILSGWACRQRILSDGRRQIVNFVLPGDLVGVCRHPNPVASTALLAVTEVVTCSLPTMAQTTPALAEAFAVSAALDEHYHLAQITRLGRLSAPERLADWLLELQERLGLAGLCSGDQLPVPLTQEFLADLLGLTSVHVNRTLQSMRRDDLLASKAGTITLLDRARLQNLVDFRPGPTGVGPTVSV